MQMFVVLPMTLVLGTLVSGFPSNPHTNGYAYTGQQFPGEDTRRHENRGLQFEGGPGVSRSFNANPNPNQPHNYPQGFPPNSGNNFNRQPPGNTFPPRDPQNNPQGFPLNDGSSHPVGNMPPSYPGITFSHGTMDPHLMRRPVLGRPGNPSRYPVRPVADPNKPIEMKPAFAGCERHSNSTNVQQTGGHYETIPVPMKDKSHIALYPMIDDNHALYVRVMMPSMQYKAKIEGSNVKLEKCQSNGVACQIEDETSSKSNNLIQPQQWNYMYSQISNGKITIGISERARVMTMSNIPEEDLDNAEWLVSSGDGPRSTEADGSGTIGGPFLVQFPCAEYVAQHFSSTEHPGESRTDHSSTHGHGHTAPIVGGYTTEPSKNIHGGFSSKSDQIASIILGVVIAVLLIALLVVIAISIHRKRTAYPITELTHLSERRRAAATAAPAPVKKPPHPLPQEQDVDLCDEKK